MSETLLLLPACCFPFVVVVSVSVSCRCCCCYFQAVVVAVGITCSNKAHRRHAKANFQSCAAGGATI